MLLIQGLERGCAEVVGPAEENAERRVLVLVLPVLGKLAIRCVGQCNSAYSVVCAAAAWPKVTNGEQRGAGCHGREALPSEFLAISSV